MAGWSTAITDTVDVRTRTHVGLGNTASYQSSGAPFTHSGNGNYTVDFEFVTRAITVTCATGGSSIDFGNDNDTAFVLPQGMTRFEVKCKQINITNAF